MSLSMSSFCQREFIQCVFFLPLSLLEVVDLNQKKSLVSSWLWIVKCYEYVLQDACLGCFFGLKMNFFLSEKINLIFQRPEIAEIWAGQARQTLRFFFKKKPRHVDCSMLAHLGFSRDQGALGHSSLRNWAFFFFFFLHFYPLQFDFFKKNFLFFFFSLSLKIWLIINCAMKFAWFDFFS
jgi:hypothetical protein